MEPANWMSWLQDDADWNENKTRLVTYILSTECQIQANLPSTSQVKEISLSFYTLSARKTYKH